MRTLFSCLALSGFCLSVLVAGCDPGAQCAIDTDCELGEYCSNAGQCLELGTSGDGGGPRDVGTPSDGGPPRDAPRADAPPTDAPVTPEDTLPDAPATCPDVAATYPLMSVGIGCGPITATDITLTGPAPSECAFEVSLSGRVAGAIAQNDRGFSGLVDYAATGAVECEATFDATFDNLTMTCGACVFTATRTRP
jgi:hypothetical protein